MGIADSVGGLSVAVNVLGMRLHSDHANERKPAPEVAEAGRVLLSRYQFQRRDRVLAGDDYDLGKIAAASLGGESGRLIAQRLCRDLAVAVERHEASAHDHDELMSALFKAHPTDVLDELFRGEPKAQRAGVRLMNDLLRFRKNPIREVPDAVIIAWCDVQPAARYPLAAAVALMFKRPSEGAPYEWTRLAKQLFLKAPDPAAVLSEVMSRFYPQSWSGSLATRLESRLVLLNELDITGVPALAPALVAAKAELQRRIVAERRAEIDEERARGGRFE